MLARTSRTPSSPLSPRRTTVPLGRQHRLDQIEGDRVVVDHHHGAIAARRGGRQCASASRTSGCGRPASRGTRPRRARSPCRARRASRRSPPGSPPSPDPPSAARAHPSRPAAGQQDVEDDGLRPDRRGPARGRSSPSAATSHPKPAQLEIERAAVRPIADRPRPTAIGRARLGGSAPRAPPAARACAGAAAGGSGSRTRRCCRRRRSLSTHIRPPCSSTIRFDSVSPRPVPSRCPRRRCAAALERLEDPLLVSLGNADAGVADGDLDLRRRLACAPTATEPPSVGELHRVGEQVQHDLLHPAARRPRRRRRRERSRAASDVPCAAPARGPSRMLDARAARPATPAPAPAPSAPPRPSRGRGSR